MTKFKMPKLLMIIILAVVLVLSPVILLLLGLFTWATASIIGTWLLIPNPPKPEITYGEFPFEIVYEIDGEVITINDIYVCEYVGIGANAGGKYRKWKSYIKSSGEEDLILLEDGNLKFACYVGFPQYYMGNSVPYNEEYTPFIDIIDPPEYIGYDDELLLIEEYKIKLISWKLSEPIINSFN